ncbi:MAG: LysR family transcriptional regulator [Caenibius sp.]
MVHTRAMAGATFLKIKIQIMCGSEIAMGPGKADLLEAIACNGSISAAARAIGMSYRRAWLLVDTMNRCWEQPLIATMTDGGARGGAKVTDFGNEVLGRFRNLQKQALLLGRGADWHELEQHLRQTPLDHQVI